MKLTVKIAVISLSAFTLSACGSNDKKDLEPPAYWYAKQGKPLAVTAPKGIKLPDLNGALIIPKVNRPLGEYNPDLIQPPNVVETPAESE